ncbi:hypothetical protein D7M11_02115 [Paenibacillus ginsengarvi]|uniref:dUTPase n=2 Tax=Paenibacillus ginsengarvi TaxID=400777 RepID=A0A3B0CS01_9BACL|nr:hypothetical protein D7M11_02115 [Paenibacillus ginsengarvi]
MSEVYTLKQLYEMQKELDVRIIKEKGLEGVDLLPNTVLALQVEVGELANEWRGFKHWSNDQSPRTKKIHSDRDAYLETNPLLEEYVDCLHFNLSLYRQLNLNISNYLHEDLSGDLTGLTEAFIHAFDWASKIYWATTTKRPSMAEKSLYRLTDVLLTIAKLLGFTRDQIAEAYIAKNKTNHDRQTNGY